MTEQEINNIFAKLVSDQMFDSFNTDQECAAKVFMFISGADAMREELLSYLKKQEEENIKTIDIGEMVKGIVDGYSTD